MKTKAEKAIWWSRGLRFGCKGCGACCTGEAGYIWLTAEELRDIAKYCGVEPREFRRKSTRKVWGKTTLIEQRGGDCLMYQDGRGCLIYPVRPMQCRTYPFWKKVMKSRKTWNSEGRECPGIGKGTKFSHDEIKDRLRQKW